MTQCSKYVRIRPGKNANIADYRPNNRQDTNTQTNKDTPISKGTKQKGYI